MGPPVSSNRHLIDTSVMKIVGILENLFVSSIAMQSLMNHRKVKLGLYGVIRLLQIDILDQSFLKVDMFFVADGNSNSICILYHIYYITGSP